jgi:hypothetical protein
VTPEQVLDKNIMLWCGEHDWLCFHTNVGKVQMIDGRYFDTGLPKGWLDLLILTNKSQVIFCETKIHPRKPTKEQINTIEVLRKRGFLAFVAYSLEEFIEAVEKYI